MSLSKKQCEDSLSNLYYVIENPCDGCAHNETQFCYYCNIKEDLSVMRKLVHEHFGNKELIVKDGKQLIDKCRELTEERDELEKTIDRLIDLYTKEYCLRKSAEFKLYESKWNPPLEFDELKIGMWIWDDKYKMFNAIIALNENYENEIQFLYTFFDLKGNVIDADRFERYRFYKCEIKDDDNGD